MTRAMSEYSTELRSQILTAPPWNAMTLSQLSRSADSEPNENGWPPVSCGWVLVMASSSQPIGIRKNSTNRASSRNVRPRTVSR